MTKTPPQFDQLVFSGGGTRCFWQGGFLDVVRDPLGLDPARIAGVSGGALSAACYVARAGQRLLDIMAEAFATQDANVNWHDRDESDGLTPHQRIYREVVETTIDAEAQQAVADGPVFQVLLAHPPGDDHETVAGALSTLAYEAELHLVSSPHMDWPETLGLTRSLVDARAAAREGRLADLVCIAATIPPIFDIGTWDGRPVVDGGLADQAPMPDPDTGTTLVLLTREYRKLPDVEGRTYLWPRDETPADKIDFTDPEKIRQTWADGVADGERYLRERGIA